jgi:topoisomerase-4 subunit A
MKDGGLSDLKTFAAEKGLTWQDTSGRTFSLKGDELADWNGARAEAGRLVPKGFPRSGLFAG